MAANYQAYPSSFIKASLQQERFSPLATSAMNSSSSSSYFYSQDPKVSQDADDELHGGCKQLAEYFNACMGTELLDKLGATEADISSCVAIIIMMYPGGLLALCCFPRRGLATFYLRCTRPQDPRDTSASVWELIGESGESRALGETASAPQLLQLRVTLAG